MTFTCTASYSCTQTATATATAGYQFNSWNVTGGASVSVSGAATTAIALTRSYPNPEMNGYKNGLYSSAIQNAESICGMMVTGDELNSLAVVRGLVGARISATFKPISQAGGTRPPTPPSAVITPGGPGRPTTPPVTGRPPYIAPRYTPCFPIGALVSTPSGSKKIESIVKGDVVWGWNSDSTGFVPAKVASIGSYENLRVRHLVITDGTKRFNFDVTFNHNLLIKREGKFESVPAGSLKVGDIVHVRADEKEELRSLQVAEIAANPTVERVFNIEIENARGYFVNGVLVESMSNQETVAVRQNSDRLK